MHINTVTNKLAWEDHEKNHSMRTHQEWPFLKSDDAQASPERVRQLPSARNTMIAWSILHPEASNLSLTVHMSISMYALVVSKYGPRSCSINITWEPDRQILDVMCIHLPIYIQAYKLTSPTSCPHVTFSTPNCTPNILNHNPPCRISSSDLNARSSLKGTAEYHSKVNTFSSVSPILLDSTTKST